MSDEEFQTYYAGIFKSAADAGYGRAKEKGIEADMVTMLQKAAEITGQTWTPPAELEFDWQGGAEVQRR